IYYRHTRERLRDVGTNIKEGITGLSGGVIEGIKSGIHTAGEYVLLLCYVYLLTLNQSLSSSTHRTVIAKPNEFFKRNTTESSAESMSADRFRNYQSNFTLPFFLAENHLTEQQDQNSGLTGISLEPELHQGSGNSGVLNSN